MFRTFQCIILGLCLAVSTGCTAKKSVSSLPRLKPPPFIKPSEPGIYHAVKRGQTLWKISHIYSVDMHELVAINRIANACKIEVGQKIFIPDRIRKMKAIKNTGEMKTTFIWPYRGSLLTCFNQKKQNVKNHGIDIKARPGAPINAAASGNVIFTSDSMRGYGKTIIIQHKNNFTTIYTNNRKNLVKTGDYVKQGQTIASAGSSGRTTDCIVHFELRKNNKPQNPLYYLP